MQAATENMKQKHSWEKGEREKGRREGVNKKSLFFMPFSCVLCGCPLCERATRSIYSARYESSKEGMEGLLAIHNGAAKARDISKCVTKAGNIFNHSRD